MQQGYPFAVIDKTGHYKASPRNVATALGELQRQGLDIRDTIHIHFMPGMKLAYIMAIDVVAAGGDLSRCHIMAVEEPFVAAQSPWLDFVRTNAADPNPKSGLYDMLVAQGVYRPPAAAPAPAPAPPPRQP